MNIVEATKLINELRNSEEYMEIYGGASNEPMNVALEIAVDSMQKQEPMKPKAVEDKIWCCPACWNNLLQIWSEYPTKKMELNRGLPYCLGCGQAIDWSEE